MKELNEFCLEYYEKVNSFYISMKNKVINSINNIYNEINNTIEIWYNRIENEYTEIKNNFNSINEKISNESTFNITYTKSENNYEYNIVTYIEKIIFDKYITFDIIFEDKNKRKPKIIGSIINKNDFNNFTIDYNPPECGKPGKKVVVNLNNICLSTLFNFNAYSNKADIEKEIMADNYSIETYFYLTKELFETVIVGGTKIKYLKGC